MPIISGGGGGGAPSGAAGGDLGGTYPNPTADIMSGGTISGELLVKPGAAVSGDAVLEAWAAAGEVQPLLFVRDNANNAALLVQRTGALQLNENTNGDTIFSVTATGGLAAGALTVFSTDGNGTIYSKAHTEPAAGNLSANQYALWLDGTNGAAKLMVKAKQADGTVVTAAIALA